MARLRALLRAEDGVSAAIVAIVFGSLLTGALLTLVGDLGQAYVERRELQNGADAAALSGATNCAEAMVAGRVPLLPCGAVGDATSEVSPFSLANANASDGLHAITQLCAKNNGTAVDVAACSDAAFSSCLAVPTGSSALAAGAVPFRNYVKVRTRTLTGAADHPATLDPVFARLLDRDATGLTLSACAHAAWGGPASQHMTLPVAMSRHCWDLVKAAGEFNPPPPYANPPSALEQSREFSLRMTQSTLSTDWRECALNLESGAFGWLQSAAGEICRAGVSGAGDVLGKTGVSTTQDCKTALNALVRTTPVTIAIFDTTTGTGSGTYFHIIGFAKFWITGYTLPVAGTYTPYLRTCPAGDKCLFGWFLEPELIPTGAVDPGQTELFGIGTVSLVS